MGTLHEDLRICVTVCCCILVKMRNVSGKVLEKIKTHILYSKRFFENRADCANCAK